MEGHRVVVLQFVRVIDSCNCLWNHFTASNSVNYIQLLIGQLNVFHVELISDCSPPVFVFWLLNEFLDFINCFGFCDFLEFVVIPKMFKLIVPPIWNLTYFDFNLLILLIKGLIITNLGLIDFLIFIIFRTGTLEILIFSVLASCRYRALLISFDHCLAWRYLSKTLKCIFYI